MRSSRILLASLLATLSALGATQKKPLDHGVYDGWKSIRGTVLSRDGKWLAYVVAPQEGDAVGTIRNVASGSTVSIPRASAIQFSRDGKWALATVVPAFEEARKAKRDNVPAVDQPKNELDIVDLERGTTEKIERVASFTLPKEDTGWFSYRLEATKAAPAAPKPEERKPDEGGDQGPGGRRAGANAAVAPAARGGTVVLRRFGTGKEERLEFVDASAWDKAGRTFAYSTVADKDGKGSKVETIDLATDKRTPIASGTDKAKYPKLALTEDGSRLAWTSDADDLKAKKPALALYTTALREVKPTAVPIPNAGESVNEDGALRFTPSGKRLVFATSKRPLPDPPAVPDDEKVSVDIWTYNDPEIMPQQLVRAAVERARGYTALYEVASRKTTQIETPELRSVQIGDEGDAAFGLADNPLPYRVEATYDPGYSDLVTVDLTNGTRRRLLEHAKTTTSLSPDGRTVAVFVAERKAWVAYDLATGHDVPLSAKIPYPVANELNDVPEFAPAYGVAGWTKDGRVLVRDKYDLWLCDPKGIVAPQNLTQGRARNLVFTAVDLDPDVRTVDVDNLPLTAMDDRTKAGGLYWRRNGAVQRIFQEDRKFAFAAKAPEGDALVFTREDVTEYPDLWVTNARFEQPTKVTDANPQQRTHNWLRSELVTWTSADGTPLQGILYKPEDFDSGKKYPMITYFYERSSERLHSYIAPSPSASSINIPLFVSQGYLVFVPDIPYKIGDPGLSALNAIVPGVSSIVSHGYVDPKRLGIQGQSWGGYQVGYLVTVTNMFAAAEAGAPVVDMFSAYGGVRYTTGLLRQMQYEHEQSRIGGTPWDSFTKYVDNSPLFRLDRVQTPLMIMSNDKDGAVPHTQGIEFYSAMRRLGKPCWMVVYNDEDHNLVLRKNRKDISIRLSQFFDHFLKGAPMPVWMAQGVPATEKGRTMGTELTKG